MTARAVSKGLIQSVAALRQKKYREETGRILVEARHPIEEAIRAGLTLHEVFLLKDAPLDSLPRCPLPQAAHVVDEATMSRMASTSSPPPCLAVFDTPKPAQKLQGELVLVLDGIQDPGNLGTLARSAAAFGFKSLILTDDSVEPYNPKVIRSSAGLIFTLHILERPTKELPQLLDGWRLFITTGHSNAVSYRAVDYTGHCAIVLGNEGQGVSPALFELPGAQAITIPMDSAVESLNVAISGSVIMAEVSAARQNAASISR